jgi:transposase
MRSLLLGLRDADREQLMSLMRSSSARAGLAQRARIVLLAADGTANVEIARLVGVSLQTVGRWRQRYAAGGLAALDDRPRSGRPRTVDHRAVVAATLTPPPKQLGATHWSSRPLADRLGIANSTVARAWRD